MNALQRSLRRLLRNLLAAWNSPLADCSTRCTPIGCALFGCWAFAGTPRPERSPG